MTFMMDRSSCISMGFPALIDERDIRCYPFLILELTTDKLCLDSHDITHIKYFVRKLDGRTMPIPRRCPYYAKYENFISICCSDCSGLALWCQACRAPAL